MSDIYQYAGTVEVPKKSLDPLAHIVTQRFNEAVMWQNQEFIGTKTLHTVLQECYDQYNGNLSCLDREIAEELGVDVYVNLTASKAGLVQSFLVETLIQGGSLPWTIAPTPIPDLSDAGRYEVLQKLHQEIFANGYTGDLQELTRTLKTATMSKEYETAKDAAENMERLMTDQCLEGGWNNAMYGFITDFTVYPYAVMHGPIPTRKARLVWNGDKLVKKYENFYEFNHVSPWDFWYSPDSPDTQRGTGVFIRQRWTLQKLLDAAKIPSYIKSNVMKVIENSKKPNFNFKWLSGNPDQPDDYLALWTDCSYTVDVLIHYGFFSGRELRKYNVTHVEDDEFYNATITVINGYTVQVVVPKNPNIHQRPVHTASFYKKTDRIPNESIAQRLRDVERCYLLALRYMMSNAGGSSGPITEADYQRLSKYMTDEDIARIVPNTVYLADTEIGSSNPALRFYSIPNATQQYLGLLGYFMDLADRITNIPAALHGIAQGTGVNRTFRGAAMLQNNATKAISAAAYNMDHFVFTPLAELLYNYNMLFHSDEAVKGDCRVVAQGSSGLLQREIDRQNSYEILQLTASAGNQLAQVPNGGAILTWALNNVLRQMGVPKELLSTTGQVGPHVQGPTGDLPPADAAPAMEQQPTMGV